MEKTEKPKSSWQERKTELKHKWLTPFIYVEWYCEWLSYLLGRWALLDILGHVGRFSILVSIIVGVYVYWSEADERRMQAENQRKAKHYQAWQVINAAHGKPGSGGRIDALQDLNKDKVSLNGVDLSNAFLPDIELKYADLEDANFSVADLKNANFSGAYLRKANFFGADLKIANFSGAVLQEANLSGADLINADLSYADLSSATLIKTRLFRSDLTGANLIDSDLRSASLSSADLSGTCFESANLTDAQLSLANLKGAEFDMVDVNGANLTGADLRKSIFKNVANWQKIQSIQFANIYGIRDAPEGFIEWAKENGAGSFEKDGEWEKFVKEQKEKLGDKKFKTTQ
jgi:uncharacterized protein YjbI with pentapeptide repeats